MQDWPKAVAIIAVSAAVFGATWLTGSAYCLWGLVAAVAIATDW